MAISVEWGTKVITVNKVDMVLIQSIPSIIYEMDLDVFRLALGELLANGNGMAFPDTHIHTPPTSIGSIALARVVELINGYTVTYEDDGTITGQYRVQIVNGNSNLEENINVNQVSVSTSNSAGLISSSNPTAEEIADAIWNKQVDDNKTDGTFGGSVEKIKRSTELIPHIKI